MAMADLQGVAPFKGKRVLTIDDAETIRTYLRNVLASKGAVVDGAATGQEGLAMCARQTYDLILLDLLLPDVDGIEVLKTIRAADNTSTIVMVTGHGGIRSAIAALQMGADGYIEKQDITSTARDHIEFLYALMQAIDHRAGIVAQGQLEKIRADFYSMVTHDLRSPSSVILTSVQMLTDNLGEPLTANQRDLILNIGRAAQRLLTLINDYLDFAKIDAGYLQLDCAMADLHQVVESSVQFAQVQVQARQQTLTVDVPATPVIAWCDADRLKRVLDNLLSNAIKYTPAGGQIALQLRVEGERATFQVSDTGNGIPPQHLAALFTRYHRSPGEGTRSIPGTGLGLLIVKEIVEAHGGDIHVESEGVPGKGSTFVFRIPLQGASGDADPAAGSVFSNPSSDFEAELDTPGTADAELHQAFVEETQRHVELLRDFLHRLSYAPGDQQLIEAAQRVTHMLKGNAAAMQATATHDQAAQIDDILRQARKRAAALTPGQVANMERALDEIELAVE